MINIIKELKTINKSENYLTSEQIVEAFKQGVIFSDIRISDIDYKETLRTWGFDMQATNQTFFNNIETVIESSHLDLKVAQLIYYTVFENSLFGNGELLTFTNETEVKNLISTLTRIKVVDDIRPDLKNYIERVKQMSYSLEEYIELIDEYDLDINLNNIKSNDLKIGIMLHKGIMFKTVSDIVRSFGGTVKSDKILSIRSAVTVDYYKLVDVNIRNLIVDSILNMSEEQLMRESATYRKELILLRKLDINIKNKINRILRKGKTNHLPKKKNFLENATSDKIGIDTFIQEIKTLTHLQIFRLMCGINSSIAGSKYFLIRNGKLATNKDRKENFSDLLMAKSLCLKAELKKRFYNNNIKVILPENINIALPTSYKNFIGSIPFYSTINISKEGSLGMIWRDTCDYDISAITSDGCSISYYGTFKGLNIYHSGDVRCPCEKGGAEYVSYKQDVKNFNLFVNLFSDHEPNGVKKIAKIFATDALSFSVEDTPKFILPIEDFQGQIGVKYEDKFIIGGVSSGINSYGNISQSKDLIEFVYNRSNQILTLEQFINIVGWEIINKNYKKEEDDIIYDFSLDTLSKKTFIDIFGE